MASKKIDIYGGIAPIDVPRYTVAESAHHLRLPTGTVRSWVIGRHYPTAGGKRRFSNPIIVPADRATPLLSFRNLAELHVLSAIRDCRVKLPAIRNAVKYLKNQIGSDHPLVEHEFLTDGIDLFIERLGNVVSVSEGGQGLFDWTRLYLDRIDRDAQGNVLRLYPFITEVAKDAPRLIVIDPKVAFGRPCLAGTDIPTSILAERFEAGDSLKDLVDDYGCPPPAVEEAIRYERKAAA